MASIAFRRFSEGSVSPKIALSSVPCIAVYELCALGPQFSQPYSSSTGKCSVWKPPFSIVAPPFSLVRLASILSVASRKRISKPWALPERAGLGGSFGDALQRWPSQHSCENGSGQ